MSLKTSSIVREEFNAAPDIRKTGRQQVAGIYAVAAQTSRYGQTPRTQL